MPASSQTAASERRNERVLTTHEPPKLKTTLKTPPKQATNPLQFVKVGPCSLYRTAQEQLQKVQEVKKIKQEVRDDPEDWQSNLDNWKSSRRKRQEHIIERVVEVKKLELEEHDRQRRRNKTFSEMMEERGNRGRKLSISLAMYNDEDANDLSDLGIGTSSGKSSVSGDTHDDTHSVLSDRDSEIEKSHSDVDNASDMTSSTMTTLTPTATTVTTASATATIASATTATMADTMASTTATTTTTATTIATSAARKMFGAGFHGSLNHNQEYDSGTTATTSSPEPEEYTYEGAIRGYVSRVSQNIPRRSLTGIDAKLEAAKSSVNGSKTSLNDDSSKSPVSMVKVDILKRREVFEKASQKNSDNKTNNRLSGDFTGTKSIKERLSSLERQKYETENGDKAANKTLNRLSGDMSSIRERLTHLEKQASERESKSSVHRKLSTEDLETVRPLRERLSTLEKYSSSDESSVPTTANESRTHNGELTARTIKDRLSALDSARSKDATDKRGPVGKHPLCFRDQESRVDTSTPSERSSSPDSEYRVPRAVFHRSLDSLDADASSGPDTFERVQSLEELDYGRSQYPASSSSAELLNDTDREDSGIHTADVSCSVSQADEPIDEEIVQHTSGAIVDRREVVVEERVKATSSVVQEDASTSGATVEAPSDTTTATHSQFASHREAVAVNKERIVIEKADQEEEAVAAAAAANRPAAPAVEDKQQETAETSTSAGMPAAVAVVVTKRDADVDVHDAPCAAVATPIADRPPERPTNLSLAKQEVGSIDTPSPASPISKQILPLTLSNDEELIADQPFLLGPPTSVEPPKEKPPPPPVDISDDDNPAPEPLKRLNSTRRIKKELRTRRSDFLGIEGVNDDDLEPELTLTKPPDMAAILAEERRIEQLHRRSYDTDSNYEQDSSHERDSGVELGHVEDWAKQPVSPDMSQHSRQSSEPFGASVTSSEEDEITKKEREIIEVLEKEEQWRYGDNREYNSDLGEKLAHKLRELEEEKMQLEREAILRCNEDAFRKRDDSARKQEDAPSHEQPQQQHDETAKQREIQARTTEEEAKYVGDKRKDEELETQSEQLRMQNEIEEKERRVADACRKEEMRIRTMESQIREQESKALVGAGLSSNEDEFPSGEVLRVERELLQLEQEELKRQRNNLAYREQKQLRLAEQLQEQWKSMHNVAQNSIKNTQQYKYHTPAVNYRSSMPNLQFQDGPRRRPPPPPIPLTKPRMLDQRQRDVTIRNSRIPSADSIPQQVDASIRESASAATLGGNHTGQQMSRQTLQALSAVPRPRIVQGDQWRRKSDVPRGAHDVNYQHWLIQEAEQRRINERNQRSPARKSQPHVTGTSVPYNAPIRTDSKPLPDSIIQTLTQRVQNKTQEKPLLTRRRPEQVHNQEHLTVQHQSPQYTLQSQKTQHAPIANNNENQEKMLSVSGKKKCSHCGEELGRGAAMIIESLRLFYHMECFKCCVCHVRLGDGLNGTDVRVRNNKLHCHNCYSSDDGVKFSCV
ncbi:PREDICTED: LIM domain only protein 7 isoform X2 [Vollenhovia emeryi]|uniref:LIM domain only protein 7 isoform X2 n=1 Tax=Vollenhovia emeryi TaxID=411798 RepID=UPI0005F39E52|nr:PREDICTED: LIM domain only protein 7 isoform X2 [Vollenhovia emeryi]